jgi:hypothetical protein
VYWRDPISGEPVVGVEPVAGADHAPTPPVDPDVETEEGACAEAGEGAEEGSVPALGPEEVWPPAATGVVGGGTVRSLMQYRHLMASSWISSAQYGHFFTSFVPSADPRVLG